MKISIGNSVNNSQIQQGTVQSNQEMNITFQTALFDLETSIKDQLKDTPELVEITPILEENENLASDERNKPAIGKNLTKIKSILGSIGTSAVATGVVEMIKGFMVTWAL